MHLREGGESGVGVSRVALAIAMCCADSARVIRQFEPRDVASVSGEGEAEGRASARSGDAFVPPSRAGRPTHREEAIDGTRVSLEYAVHLELREAPQLDAPVAPTARQ